jgi:hypothetical protein
LGKVDQDGYGLGENPKYVQLSNVFGRLSIGMGFCSERLGGFGSTFSHAMKKVASGSVVPALGFTRESGAQDLFFNLIGDM